MNSNELESLLETYREELKDFWIMFLVIAAVGFAMIFGAVFALKHFYSLPMDWGMATILWLALLVPPVQMMFPEKPTEDTVAYNKVLNEIGRIARERNQ